MSTQGVTRGRGLQEALWPLIDQGMEQRQSWKLCAKNAQTNLLELTCKRRFSFPSMKSILNKNWANRPSELLCNERVKLCPINVCCLVSFTDQSCIYTGKYSAKEMWSFSSFYNKVQSQIWAWIFLCWFMRKERKPWWEWRREGNRKVQGNRTQCWRALLCRLSEEEVVLGPSNWVETWRGLWA